MRVKPRSWSGSFHALTLVAGVWMAALGVRADSLPQLFQRALQAQTTGDYSGAIRAYETLVEAGVDDPDVYINLANAYGRAGQYGQAIRYFERSLALSPGDAAASAGQRRAVEALGARQVRERGEAVVVARPPLLSAVFSGISRDALAIALWVSAWLFGLSAALLLRPAAEAVRIALGIGSAVAALLAIVSCLGLAVKRDFGAPGTAALVITPEVEIRQGPDASAERAGTLLEGARVRLLDRSGGSVRVRLASGVEGYAPASAIGTL